MIIFEQPLAARLVLPLPLPTKKARQRKKKTKNGTIKKDQIKRAFDWRHFCLLSHRRRPLRPIKS